jgi:NADH-quinone oxidoreductase subunit N
MKSELVVTAIIFLLLFIKVGKGIDNAQLLPIIQSLLLLNLIFGFFFNIEGNAFGDMFFSTPLIAFEKNILSLGVYLISLLCSDWLKKTAHLAEYFLLMLSALLGMFFMLSSGNLLMFYLALELASIPVAAMTNFDLDKKRSSEAAMKMMLSAAFSSGILLFGISLIYGVAGTLNFAELAQQSVPTTLYTLAFVFLFSAFAFKLSVVPFHLWTADVYEGAPVATTSFLSVISKAAIAFILITILYKVFQPLQNTWYILILILALITIIIGNLFALRQQNIKRFLAFSSIAQVGFILVGVSGSNQMGLTAVVYFLLVYVFSNLAAFGVVAVVSEQANKEIIDDYKGFYQTNPMLTWVLALALFSLAGVPPTAGFFGKFFLLTAGGSKSNYAFMILVALNMVISLYYYLRVVRAMFIDKNELPVKPLYMALPVKLGLIICSAGILLVGIFGWIFDYIQSLN